MGERLVGVRCDSCAVCSSVPAAGVTVFAPQSGDGLRWMLWECGGCGPQTRVLPAKIAAAVVEAGAAFRMWVADRELADPVRADGGRLAADDVIDLMLGLPS